MTGMGDDNSHDLAANGRGRLGVSQEGVDLAGQPRRVFLVELAGDEGRPDIVRGGGEARRDKDRREQETGCFHENPRVFGSSYPNISASARKCKLTFRRVLNIKGGRKVEMKGFFKFLLALTTLGSVFFLGYSLGKEKEKAKIPKFQDEAESNV
jgi:hypothetical protein